MKVTNNNFKDGISRQRRASETLRPDCIFVDERTDKDWLRYSLEYAKHINFFDESNQVAGDWSGLFDFNDDQLEMLQRFSEDPESISDDALFRKIYTRPHLVLFLAFLKLLRHPRRQFDNLTKRHLDFYYRNVLRFSLRPESPDSVHVIFKLAKNVSEHLIKKGTLLNAGKDSQGKNLYYGVDEDIIVNKACVTDIKTLYIIKSDNSIKNIHERHNKSDDGFEKMLCFAVGYPGQGDPLPPITSAHGGMCEVTVKFLKDTLYPLVKGNAKEKDKETDYILNRLCFSRIDDFLKCMDIHVREVEKGQRNINPPTDAEWEWVYGVIEKAYKKKITLSRRDKLKEVRESDGFLNMFEFAFGDPNPYDPLPAMPENINNIKELSEKTQSAAVAGYITETFFLSVENFNSVMARVQVEETGNSVGSANAISWEEVYILVEKAWKRKRNFVYPPMQKKVIRNVSPASVFKSEKDGDAIRERFRPFGSEIDAPKVHKTENTINSPGFAIASPVLFLGGGDREISLAVSCKKGTINTDLLKDMLRNNRSLFRIHLSSKSQWVNVIPDKIDTGNFIVEKELETYSNNLLSLICTSSDIVFKNDDCHKYLVFEDGAVYEIVKYKNNGKVFVKSAGTIQGDQTIKIHDCLKPEGKPEKLKTAFGLENNSTIKADKEIFDEVDIGKFLTLKDGSIYEISAFINAANVNVLYRGRAENIPAYSKYDKVKLSSSFRQISSASITKIQSDTAAVSFTDKDNSRLIVWDNGHVFKITAKVDDNLVNVEKNGKVSLPGEIRKYGPNAIYFNALLFKLILDRKSPQILPYSGDRTIVKTAWPVIKVEINDFQHDRQEQNVLLYEQLKTICIEKAGIRVSVEASKNILYRNDNGVIKANKPFSPFGGSPETGDGFYFASPEICGKKLDSLTLDFEWMGLPEKFSTHYDAYTFTGFTGGKKVEKNDFKTQLNLFINEAWLKIEEPKALFEGKQIYHDFQKQETDVNSLLREKIPDDLFNLSGYFKMELQEPGFYHQEYPLVMNKAAEKRAEQIAKEISAEEQGAKTEIPIVYPPYTPKAKAIIVNYTASDSIEFTGRETNVRKNNNFQIFHIHPFGSDDIVGNYPDDSDAQTGENSVFLVPQYNEQGYLYIGIKDLDPPQNISLLFQLVSGSGNPDIPPPEIKWSYLSDNRWKDFKETEILSDTTNRLVDSGIIQFSIPESATSNNTLFPSDRHWIRATTSDSTTAVSDMIDVRSQVASAVFINNENALDHLQTPLAANLIGKTVKRDPLIKQISQPYSSFNGRIKEDGEGFYTRVSERLRHKQRAITPWDYERLILEKFSQIYKVKCIRNSDFKSLDRKRDITIVVIPDISNTFPFYPLEPKAPVNLLGEILEYIRQYSSPFVKIEVRNPRYEQIQYRVAVKFKQGCDQGYYVRQLNKDIVRFLSPWAYDKTADISFGSSIHISTVANFIENRPYVDYLTKLKLIDQRFVGETFGNATARQTTIMESSIAGVRYPDSILVSAPEHIIDRITSETYEDEHFEGIGYMIVGADFTIRPPDPSSDNIGHMKIGTDFKIT